MRVRALMATDTAGGAWTFALELASALSRSGSQIDLATLTVSGTPKPAAKGDKPGAVIAAPAVAGQLTVVPPATTKDPLAARKPAEAEAAKQPAAAAPAAAAPAAAAPKPAVDLHGGSVPAPKQKTPGQ